MIRLLTCCTLVAPISSRRRLASVAPLGASHASSKAVEGEWLQMTSKTLPHHWIEYVRDWRCEPMAYWVHIEGASAVWKNATVFDPPAPAAVPNHGYPVLCVESAGTVFRFSSMAQLVECARVLSLKPLPTSSRLTSMRAGNAARDPGPNRHWLSRLPARVKSPKGRRRVVDDLGAILHSRTPESVFWRA